LSDEKISSDSWHLSFHLFPFQREDECMTVMGGSA
jgi:hypothetical protein